VSGKVKANPDLGQIWNLLIVQNSGPVRPNISNMPKTHPGENRNKIKPWSFRTPGVTKQN